MRDLPAVALGLCVVFAGAATHAGDGPRGASSASRWMLQSQDGRPMKVLHEVKAVPGSRAPA
ncbi:hypothetical protein [Mesorhizobium sp. B3-1-6]|uniref:hypothetical protein n=1 Tax=Mesorhizobium sp. B3-1-6 TaxID=2589895 RepID=UPI0015E416B1|nr:hypothetical protein [Mesorhizobium sp. B3-1-6]